MLGSTNVGLRVRDELAIELRLEKPSITCYVARDGVAEITNFLALVGGSLGRIALDVIIVSSNELDEVCETFVPQKRRFLNHASEAEPHL